MSLTPAFTLNAVTTSPTTGSVVSLVGATQNAAMNIICTGGTATVVLECNGGTLSTSGAPPSADWVDVSGGGYSMTSGQTIAKVLPYQEPYWRCRVTAISGATVSAYVPLKIIDGGIQVSASGVPLSSGGPV